MLETLMYIFGILDEMGAAFAEEGLYLDLNYSSVAYSYILTSAIIGITFFILKGVGLFCLSRRQSLSCAWLSFVPVLSYVQMGRLVGEIKLFGTKTKQLGVFVAVSLFITEVLGAVVDFSVWFEQFSNTIQTNVFDGKLYQQTLENFSPLMTVFQVIGSLASIVYIVLWVFLIIGFFRYYEPKHPTLYAVLSILLDLTGVFVFAVRKHDKVNYYEAQRKYYENLYRQNYGGENRGNSANQSDSDDSPFIEYSKNKKSDDVFGEYSANNNTDTPTYDNKNGGEPNNSNGGDDSDEDLF